MPQGANMGTERRQNNKITYICILIHDRATLMKIDKKRSVKTYICIYSMQITVRQTWKAKSRAST